MDVLIRYVVQNKDGLFFKRHGRKDPEWVSNINDSRVYAKTGGPRSLITWFMNNRPNEIPNLIKVTSTSLEIIDESDRLDKVKSKNKQYEIKLMEHNKNQKLAEIARTEEILKKLKNEIF